MEVQAIVDELAQAIGRPITLEDADGRLLAYSVHEQPVDVVRVETLLRRGASSVTLEALRSRGVYQFVDSCEGLARVPPIPELGFAPRACMAIRGPSRVLGYLWVVDPDSSLSKSAEGTLLRSRHRISVELARRDSTLQAKQQQRSLFVQELCGGDHPGDEALSRQAKALGWYYSPPLVALVIRGRSVTEQAPAVPPDIEDVLNQHCPSCLRGIAGDEVVAVLCGHECCSSAELAREIAEFLTHRDKSSYVGAGGLCENLSQVRRSYLEAQSAISLGSELMAGVHHFDYGTLAPYELLSCMATCKKPGSYGREPVEKIVTYDRLHGGSLLPTLEAFLDFYGRRKQAASRLRIHPNTLDYRIGKVRELTGLDLDDPNTRLVVHVWVKALAAQARGRTPRD